MSQTPATERTALRMAVSVTGSLLIVGEVFGTANPSPPLLILGVALALWPFVAHSQVSDGPVPREPAPEPQTFLGEPLGGAEEQWEARETLRKHDPALAGRLDRDFPIEEPESIKRGRILAAALEAAPRKRDRAEIERRHRLVWALEDKAAEVERLTAQITVTGRSAEIPADVASRISRATSEAYALQRMLDHEDRHDVLDASDVEIHWESIRDGSGAVIRTLRRVEPAPVDVYDPVTGEHLGTVAPPPSGWA